MTERVVDLLEAIEVDQQHRGGVVATQLALGAPVQQLAVGQAGQRVVQRLVAQAPRGAGDDPVESREEDHQAAAQQQREQQHVLADLLSEGVVAHVDLEHGRGLAPRREPDRHVDLEHALARPIVGRAVLEVAHDLAGERRVHVAALERVIADDRPVVGVDEPAVAVEQLDREDAVVVEEAGADLAVDLGEPLQRDRVAEVAVPELRSDADLGDHAGVLDGVRQRALLDLVLEHEPDREPQRGHDDEAHGGEPPEQGHTSRPRPHTRVIGELPVP